ncbi:hypothetical protein [Paracoccus sp. ME4]|uniref:hypothetical protein n=1 Tax=Paracoccus sp. ME4 TaxID=3138066 RepID=UPI00398AA66C
MTPLHPLAAVAAGTVLGLAALTAPNTTPTRGLEAPACSVACIGGTGEASVIGAQSDTDVHIVTAPGRYGLAQPPEGDAYAVIAGQLVRIHREDGRVLSVLRPVPRVLD